MAASPPSSLGFSGPIRKRDEKKNVEAVRSSDKFQKQYATVIHQLRDANEQIVLALAYLRQQNTYQENSIPPWQRAIPVSSGVVSSSSMDPSTPLTLDTYPLFGEIIRSWGGRQDHWWMLLWRQFHHSRKRRMFSERLMELLIPILNVDVSNSGDLGMKLGSSV